MRLVLDTHILVAWVEGGRGLSPRVRRVIDRESQKAPVIVADISLWEIAMLVEARRIRIKVPLHAWLEAATAPPLATIASITPAIAAELASIPPWDPADRIIVATARVHGATLVTLDERIRESGLVPVL